MTKRITLRTSVDVAVYLADVVEDELAAVVVEDDLDLSTPDTDDFEVPLVELVDDVCRNDDVGNASEGYSTQTRMFYNCNKLVRKQDILKGKNNGRI